MATKPKLHVYYSNSFQGKHPVGTAAIMVAESEEQARAMLEAEWPFAKVAPYEVKALKTTSSVVVVLCNGDY